MGKWTKVSGIRSYWEQENAMKEAVIVAYARTGLAKSHRGSFNNLEVPSMVAPVIKAVLERANSNRVRSKMSSWERRFSRARRRQFCTAVCHCRRVAGEHRRDEHGPAMFLRHDGHCYGSEERYRRRCADRGRRWCRIHQPGAERTCQSIPSARSMGQRRSSQRPTWP